MPFMPGGDNRLAVRVEADNVGGFRRSMDSAIGVLGSFKKAAGVAAVGAAAGVGIALGKSAQAAADFETAMVEVEKVTNPETAAALSDRMLELSKTIPLTSTELAGLAADAARFGVRGVDNIENFTTVASKMATATDLSASQAGESLTKLAQLTGTPIEEIENLGSSINSLSNNFATSSSEIVDATLRSSASLRQLGLTNTEILGLNASLNEVFHSSERAGTALARVAQSLMDPKKVSDIAGALGMTKDEFRAMLKNDPSGTIRMVAKALNSGGKEADALNGVLQSVTRKALAALGQNLDNAALAMDQANESFREGTSLQREFDAATGTFNTKLKLFMNRLTEVGIRIGNVLLPWLTKALDVLLDWINATSQLVTSLTQGGNAVNRFGLDWKRLITQIRSAVNTIMNVVQPFLTLLSKLWREHAQDIIRETVQLANGIIKRIRQFVNFFMNSIWKPYGDDIVNVLRVAFDVLLGIAEQWIDTFLTAINVFLNILNGDWQGAWNEIVGFAQRSFSRLVNAFKAFDKLFTKAVLALIRVVEQNWKSWLTSLGNIMKTGLSNVLQFLMSFASRVLKAIGSMIQTVTRNWDQWLATLISIMQSGASNLIQLWMQLASKVLGAIRSLISMAVGAFTSWVSDLIGIVSNLVSGIIEWFQQLARRLIGGSIIPNMLSAILGAFSRFKGQIIGLARSIFQGVAKWFNKLADVARNAWNTAKNFGQKAINMANKAKGAAGRAASAAAKAASKAASAAADAGSAAADAASDIVGGATRHISGLGLQHGGVVTASTAAVIGEGSEPEAVLPLSRLQRFIDMPQGQTEVIVRFEGQGSLVDLVEEEAEVVVDKRVSDIERRRERLGIRRS